MTDSPQLTLSHAVDPALHALLARELVAFNSAMHGPANMQPLTITIPDAEGQAIGGLSGRTVFGWLFVELLFVPDSLRGHGMGDRLLTMAEEEARARGCTGAWLDTLNPAARAFYQRRGYAPFGELPNCPGSNSRVFLSKTL